MLDRVEQDVLAVRKLGGRGRLPTVKELTELARLWEMGSSIKSPCLAKEA
jgi:hypothetical protein